MLNVKDTTNLKEIIPLEYVLKLFLTKRCYCHPCCTVYFLDYTR